PDAQQHFQMAIQADPFNPQYHIALGTALCQQREWIQGLAQYMALDPGKDKDLVNRESRVTMEHIQKELAAGKTFDSKGWLAIGIYHVKIDHDLQAAIEAFKKSAALDPAQADAWFDLGSLYEATHNPQAAKAAYEKLLALPQATEFQKNFAAQHAAALK
ncbi:MAG: tetratricopeptide repeat protein, partial [Candidatus Omnitrophica bacterium]|nr:tetratricopeptide repeat protein [Candidatus Omnitrophota bacterium]